VSDIEWKSASEHITAGAVFCASCAHYIYPPGEHPEGCPVGESEKLKARITRLEARLAALLAEHGQAF
jgi:hypothetical protein